MTLAAASSNDKDSAVEYGGNVKASKVVGQKLAEKAKAVGITKAAYDRGDYRYHGRVKALARAATEAGLVCTGLEDVVKAKAVSNDTKATKKAAKANKAKS